MAKKKIKDLTQKEANAICKKYLLCRGCPLQFKGKGTFAICLPEIVPLKDKLEKMMERKVEVEEQ